MNDLPPVLPSGSSVPPVLGPSVGGGSAPSGTAPTPGPGGPPGSGRDLTGGLATLILVAYIAGQIAGGVLVGLPAGFFAGVAHAMRHSTTPFAQDLEALKPMLTLWGAVIGVAVGGAVMLCLCRRQLGGRLADRGPTGAAWVRGRGKHIGQGLGCGVAVGVGCILIDAAFEAAGVRATPGPLTQLLLTPGVAQTALVFLALFLAPPLEELLFRGVLYGGYRRSLGAPAAAALTTAIFVLLHLGELIGFLPSAIGITALAVTALRMRLRSSAIGPAVGVHFGYNLVITAGAIAATWHR